MDNFDKHAVFDELADAVADGRVVQAALVAASAAGEKERYFKIVDWMASKGYRPVVYAGKVTYVKKGREPK